MRGVESEIEIQHPWSLESELELQEMVSSGALDREIIPQVDGSGQNALQNLGLDSESAPVKQPNNLSLEAEANKMFADTKLQSQVIPKTTVTREEQGRASAASGTLVPADV